MKLFVREHSWMWNDLQLTLAECRVFAYIHGLTHGDKGGYDGSKRHLAELLGLDAGGVKKILDTLTEKHLIVCTDGLWHSVDSVNTPTVESVNESADSVNKSVESVNSPHSPLYNNIKDKKQEDMQANFNFEFVFSRFEPKFKNRLAATNIEWDKRSRAAQQAMADELKDVPKGSLTRNPYFFVQDFPEPQPDFLRGDEPDEDIVQVKYKGRFKLCARQTMQLFGLEFVRDWKHVKN